MTYSRLSDLYAAFGEEEILQISDTSRTGTPDHVLVRRAITNADAEINAAIATRYRVPLSPTPQLIKRISCDLARWFLWGVKPSKEVDERAVLARDLLKSLASGEMVLEGMETTAGSFARIEKSRRRLRWSSRP